ncbi:50S ribosomal protein L35 [Pseudanabaena sp. PCC 6802]|uniref:50S ribosomal protein L35 n=1 Tax=Pseudanabaena sp. PCC 6802 TaxID=118173 RepID=UPI00034799F4|nr:50S ribosomal protein L35 [Pseudanabaena sp. PCC 6802]
MPKLKTRSAAAKRFKVTGSGKLMRRRAMKNHLLEHKPTSRKSKLSKIAAVDERDVDRVKGMMPYI